MFHGSKSNQFCTNSLQLRLRYRPDKALSPFAGLVMTGFSYEIVGGGDRSKAG